MEKKQLSIDEIIYLLGAKDVEIYHLRKRIAELEPEERKKVTLEEVASMTGKKK